MKDKFLGFFSGVSFGIASAVPGLSGGTMLVIFGCYDRICRALSLDFKSIKKNLLFLIIFAAGVVAGVFGLAYAITFMIEKTPLITYLILSALILAGLPVVIKKITGAGRPGMLCIIPALLGYALVVSLFIMEMSGSSGLSSTPSPITLVIYSMFAGLASIIPGVSGSFVLVMFGVYEYIIVAVKELDFAVLAFVAAGAAIGLIGGSRLVTFLLKKAQAMVYSAILGMLAGSALMLIAGSVIKYG